MKERKSPQKKLHINLSIIIDLITNKLIILICIKNIHKTRRVSHVDSKPFPMQLHHYEKHSSFESTALHRKNF